MIEHARSIDEAVQEIFGSEVAILSRSPVHGGCINSASKLTLSTGECLFAKENRSTLTGMFRAEATGLLALKKPGGPVVPEPLAAGEDGVNQFLLTTYLPAGRPGPSYWEDFGRALATLHRHRGVDFFGFEGNNYIGSTPQRNPPCDRWISFFGTHRLGYQISLAAEQGLAKGSLVRQTETLISKLDSLIEEPAHPSTLHGDLWSGNAMADAEGNAAIFDPATYYGHNEADLAMTELFGRFHPSFYGAYNEIMPLSPEYPERKKIYGLYHILNHLNIFGSAYAFQAESIVRSFV